MSELSKRINEFFKLATRSEITKIKDEVYFSDHLQDVFHMFYIEKKTVDYIAFKTNYSKGKIEADLRLIRKKLNKLIWVRLF